MKLRVSDYIFSYDEISILCNFWFIYSSPCVSFFQLLAVSIPNNKDGSRILSIKHQQPGKISATESNLKLINKDKVVILDKCTWTLNASQ